MTTKAGPKSFLSALWRPSWEAWALVLPVISPVVPFFPRFWFKVPSDKKGALFKYGFWATKVAEATPAVCPFRAAIADFCLVVAQRQQAAANLEKAAGTLRMACRANPLREESKAGGQPVCANKNDPNSPSAVARGPAARSSTQTPKLQAP